MQAALQGASATEPDDEGLQYLDRQRHATAVQLHSRQLSIALLRAQIKMPRYGGAQSHIVEALTAAGGYAGQSFGSACASTEHFRGIQQLCVAFDDW